MRKLTSNQETWLRERFDDRFSNDMMERKIYSHDVGMMPPLVKPLIGKAIADGVVQPQDEGEVIELVRWAAQNRIPLIPRGKVLLKKWGQFAKPRRRRMCDAGASLAALEN